MEKWILGNEFDEIDQSFCPGNHNIPYNNPKGRYQKAYLLQMNLDKVVDNPVVLGIIFGTLIILAFTALIIILLRSQKKINMIINELSWGHTYNILTVLIIWAL